jgi:hypothetical protein
MRWGPGGEAEATQSREIDPGPLLTFGSGVQPERRTSFVSPDARSGQRQSDTETTSSRLVVLHPNSAAVDVHGEATKRKPKAVRRSAIGSSVGFELEVLVEDLVAPVRGHSRTEIADATLEEAVVRGHDFDADRLALGRMSNSIVE